MTAGRVGGMDLKVESLMTLYVLERGWGLSVGMMDLVSVEDGMMLMIDMW